MLLELFALGTLWFWLPVLAFIVISCAALENQKYVLSNVVFFGFVVIMLLFSDVPIFSWVAENSLQTLVIVASYFAIMVMWMYGKWYFFTKRIAQKASDMKETFFRDHQISNGKIPNNLKGRWELQLGNETGYQSLPLRASEHKNQIMAWGINWPISAVWTLVHDPVTSFARWSYYAMSKRLQDISNRNFRGTEVEFE